ncbi:MAG: transporter, partial [Planctomycetota bacterium]
MKTASLLITVILLCSIATAQEQTEQNATDLAKKTQNPISDLTSLPFQYNTFFETGPKAKTQNVLLIQPVIPLSLNDDWNLIARPIIPLLEQPPMMDGQNRNHGLGNIQFQGFFSPKDKVGDW